MKLTGDLRSPAALYLKGGLFVALAATAGGLLIVLNPSWLAAGLLAACVWGSCRAYYFAFYVVQRYADPGYRFAGLADFAAYLWRRRSRRVVGKGDAAPSPRRDPG